MNTNKLETCSRCVSNAIEYIDDNMDDPTNYDISYAPIFYILYKFESDKVKPYIKNWSDSIELFDIEYDRTPELYYISKLECEYLNEYSEPLTRVKQSIKSNQTVEGEFRANRYSTTGALRFLAEIEPDSSAVQRGVNHFCTTWNRQISGRLNEVGRLAIGALALAELDYFQYESQIKNILKYIEDEYQLSWLNEQPDTTNATTYSLVALSKLSKKQSELEARIIEQFEDNQFDPGFWIPHLQENGDKAEDFDHPAFAMLKTSHVLLGLISAGKGPKVSEEEIKWERELVNQWEDRLKSNFVSTQPSTRLEESKQEILREYRHVIRKAEHSLRISTLRIDMLHEDLINKMQTSKDFDLRLVTSSGTSRGDRKKMKKAVMNELVKRTNGGVREDQLIHTRMIIADESDGVISSADLTRDQLYDEFNAGIHTEDPDLIKKAIDLFEEMWDEADPRDVKQ